MTGVPECRLVGSCLLSVCVFAACESNGLFLRFSQWSWLPSIRQIAWHKRLKILLRTLHPPGTAGGKSTSCFAPASLSSGPARASTRVPCLPSCCFAGSPAVWWWLRKRGLPKLLGRPAGDEAHHRPSLVCRQLLRSPHHVKRGSAGTSSHCSFSREIALHARAYSAAIVSQPSGH